MGLTEQTDPERIERDLMALVPLEKWIHFGPAMVLLGRYTCVSGDPDCRACVMNDLCPKVGLLDVSTTTIEDIENEEDEEDEEDEDEETPAVVKKAKSSTTRKTTTSKKPAAKPAARATPATPAPAAAAKTPGTDAPGSPALADLLPADWRHSPGG